MTAPMHFAVTRRSLLSGGAVVLAGGVASWLLSRNSAAARGNGAGGANGYVYPHAPASQSGLGRQLVAESSVPAGGGLVVNNARVVVTKDASGAVHAFSALCTHQGCLVSSVRHGVIQCPCHGSEFDAVTGKVVRGPAPAPLNPVEVVVDAGVVYEK